MSAFLAWLQKRGCLAFCRYCARRKDRPFDFRYNRRRF